MTLDSAHGTLVPAQPLLEPVFGTRPVMGHPISMDSCCRKMMQSQDYWTPLNTKAEWGPDTNTTSAPSSHLWLFHVISPQSIRVFIFTCPQQSKKDKITCTLLKGHFPGWFLLTTKNDLLHQSAPTHTVKCSLRWCSTIKWNILSLYS